MLCFNVEPLVSLSSWYLSEFATYS